MPYKAIFEIGPISDYIHSTRKTKDLWGGSFLFSYLMGYAAKLIIEHETGKKNIQLSEIKENINKKILRPNLFNDPLFNLASGTEPEAKIDAGSIPDQFYCELENEDTPKMVKQGLLKHLETLYDSCLTKLMENYKRVPTDRQNGTVKKQIQDYFRFFFVLSSNNQNQNVLKNASATRADLFEITTFKDEVNSPESKHQKCSLCGDRQKVITLLEARRNKRDEHLCAICTIKRGLLDNFKKNLSFDKFQSTTDIAAQIPKQLALDHFENFKELMDEFRKAHEESKEAKDELNFREQEELKRSTLNASIIEKLSYQFYFSDHQKANRLREAISEKAELRERFWVKHGYFSIVALDGDNTGKIMEEFEKKNKLAIFSKAVQTYTRDTAKIINNYNGQLIYCGGEDTLAIIHPIRLLNVVKELNSAFQNSFSEALRQIPDYNPKLSISAGAVMCHHKHPLSLAIKKAHHMLDFVAKDVSNKAALAVRLIKGGSDRCDFVCKIADSEYNLNHFQELIGSDIPRGFVYKLIDEKEILANTLTEPDKLIYYLYFLFEKTRAKIDDSEKLIIKTKLEKLKHIYENSAGNFEEKFQKIIDYLYFARFLEGGE